MDYHKEIRHSYLGGFTILLLEGIFWILAGVVGQLGSKNIGILIIIFSGVFFYPLSQLFQLILKRPKISKENPLKALFTQISLIIPFSFPLIFMLIKENVNLFFPALSIIVGAHYLPFIFSYQMKTYWLLSALLVIGGIVFGFIIEEHFANCAYFTGSILILFSIIHRYLIKKEIRRAT